MYLNTTVHSAFQNYMISKKKSFCQTNCHAVVSEKKKKKKMNAFLYARKTDGNNEVYKF